MSQTAYDAALDAFRASMAEAVEAGAGKPWRVSGRATKANPNKEDGSWWYSNGPAFVHAYYTWRQNNPHLKIWTTPTGTPAIELEVAVNIGNDTKIKGGIDRVFVNEHDGERLIVDLKSGKAPSSGLQLAVYRLALLKQFGDAPRYGAYWLAREGTLGQIFDLSQYHEDMVARWMRDVYKAINLGIFVPNMGQLCDYCGVRKDCYAFGSTTYVPDFNNDLIEESK